MGHGYGSIARDQPNDRQSLNRRLSPMFADLRYCTKKLFITCNHEHVMLASNEQRVTHYSTKITLNTVPSAALDLTTTPDSERSTALLIGSCNIPGAAALGAEKSKVSEFLKRQREVAQFQNTDHGIIWNRDFQFRPWHARVRGLGPWSK